MSRVLANLLSNARKYSPDGGSIMIGAAIVGGMVSFPIAVGAAFGIGLGEEWARHYLLARDAGFWQGAPEVLTLGAVILSMTVLNGMNDNNLGVFAGIEGNHAEAVALKREATALLRQFDGHEPGKIVRWLVFDPLRTEAQKLDIFAVALGAALRNALGIITVVAQHAPVAAMVG